MSLGLPDAAAGVAWPFVRDALGAAPSGLGLMLLCAGAGYLVSALLAGSIVGRWGVGNVLFVSTALVALGLAGYAVAPTWPLFLACGPVVGLGSGAIDSGLNAFAAKRFSARHMSWLHAFYGVGATLGPLILTSLLSHGGTWREGYGTLAALQALATIAFFASLRLMSEPRSQTGGSAPATTVAPARDALRSRIVWLQVAIFLLYTGIEVTVGQWSFTVQKEAAGASIAGAGFGTALFWGSLTGGRFTLGFVVERLGAVRLVRAATIGAALGCALFAFGGSSALVRIGGLALSGFSLASIYPTLMSETPRRVGEHLAPHAVGWQVGAAMGGALVLPAAVGWLAQTFGLAVVGGAALAAALALVALHEALLAALRAD